MKPGKIARQVALEAVHAVIAKQGSLDSVLQGPAGRDLSPGELTLARMIASVTVRHWFHLRQILDTLVTRDIKPKDRIIDTLMMTALAQLAFTRQAEHAVVAESVALGPENGRPWARGLINAVLRNFLRNKAQFLMEKHSEEAQLNHPNWLIGKLRKAYPDHYRLCIGANNLRAPMTLRVNIQKTTPADYLTQLTEQGFDARLGPLDSLILENPVPVARLPNFDLGWVSVQDLSAQYAAHFLSAEPGMRILDACAAPGGKTCHLAERFPEASITALDNSESRLERVTENLARLDLSAEVICADAAEFKAPAFDRILLDAPCTGTGVIRRHPDIRLARDPDGIKDTVKLQREILNHCWSLLKPGGQLLYATCSVLPEENHKQIQGFLDDTPDASLETLTATGSIPVPAGLQLLPGLGEGDGFYYASLIKSASSQGVTA